MVLTLVACGQNKGQEQAGKEANESQDRTEQAEKKLDLTGKGTEVSTDITKAVEKVEAGIVSVINLQSPKQQQLPFPYGAFFNNPQNSDELEQAGTGSGAIYKVAGDKAYIFTNYHVIAGSEEVEVMYQNGDRVKAEIVGADPYTDLAVLSVSSKGADTVLKFGNSDVLKVGEPAIAIGSPLGTGFASSVTLGIISGINRSVPVDTDGDKEYDWEMNVLQTDAAINPGNSGGPLINIAGEVVGINSMKVSTNNVEGMGFAIPINDAASIIQQLEEKGEVVRPMIGITMIDAAYLSAEDRQQLGLPKDLDGGVVVQSVLPNSSAADAGLKQWDVITHFDGEEIKNGNQLRQAIYSSKIGAKIEVKFIRQGKKETATLEMRQGQPVNKQATEE